GAHVIDLRIRGGHYDRRVPVPAQRLFTRLRLVGPDRRNHLSFERGEIDAVGATALRLEDDGVRIGRIDVGVEAIAAPDVPRIGIGDAVAVRGRARHAPDTV